MSAHKSTHAKSRPQSPQHPKCVYEFVRRQNENRNNEYQLIKVLGEGGFAKCYKTKRTNDQKEFAIKAINLDEKSHSSTKDKKKSSKSPQASMEQKAMAQANFLKVCSHRNIVRYQTHFKYDNVFYIVMEHCSYGSFGDMLKHRKTITEVQARYYISQMISGLIYLREKRIIHRDLKPANYLLNQRMELKIGDFGLATQVKNGTPVFSNICGTPNYLSPEMLSKTDYSYEVDVWSLGVALYAMLYGMPPFETKKKDAKETYQKIKKCQYTLSSNKVSVSPQAKDLIQKILILNPSKRIPLQQILDHPFMSYFNIPRQLPYRCLRKEPDSRFLNQYEGRIRGGNEGYRGRSLVASVRQKASYNKFNNEKGQDNNKKPMRYCPPEFQKEQKPNKSFTKCQYDKYQNIRESIRKEIKKMTSEKRLNQQQSEPRRQKSIGQVMKKFQQQQVVTSSPISSNASLKGSSHINKYIQYPSQSPNSNRIITQNQPQSGTISNIYYEFPAESQPLVNDDLASYASIECEQPSPELMIQIPFPSFAHMMKPLSYKKGENYEEYLKGLGMDWREIERVNVREGMKEGDKRRSFKIGDQKARPKNITMENNQALSNFSTKKFETNICSLEDFLVYSSSIHASSSKLFKMVYYLKQQPSPNSHSYQSSLNQFCHYIGLIFNDNSSIITKLTSSQNQITYASVFIRNVQSMRTNKKNLYEKVVDENDVQNGGDQGNNGDWIAVQLDFFGKEIGVKSADGSNGNNISLEMNYQFKMKLKLASSTFKLLKYTISKDFPQLFNKPSKSHLSAKPILQQTPKTLKDFKFINMYHSHQSNLYFELNDGSKHYLQKRLKKKAHLQLFRKDALTDVRSYRYAVYISSKRAAFLKDAHEQRFKVLSFVELNANVSEKRVGPVSRKEDNIKILQEEFQQGEIQRITKKVKQNEESSRSSSSKQSYKFSQKQNLIPTLPKQQNGATTDMLQKICKQFQSRMGMHYMRERDAIIKKRQQSNLKEKGEISENPSCEFRENRFCRFEIQNGNLEFIFKKQGGI